jgi:hypothetical protein
MSHAVCMSCFLCGSVPVSTPLTLGCTLSRFTLGRSAVPVGRSARCTLAFNFQCVCKDSLPATKCSAGNESFAFTPTFSRTDTPLQIYAFQSDVVYGQRGSTPRVRLVHFPIPCVLSTPSQIYLPIGFVGWQTLASSHAISVDTAGAGVRLLASE